MNVYSCYSFQLSVLKEEMMIIKSKETLGLYSSPASIPNTGNTDKIYNSHMFSIRRICGRNGFVTGWAQFIETQ